MGDDLAIINIQGGVYTGLYHWLMINMPKRDWLMNKIIINIQQELT
jgi:hypothetical protein